MSTLEVKAIQAPTGYDLQMPAGHILQVVTGSGGGVVNSSSNSFVDTGLSATITPSSTSSKILVISDQNVSVNGSQEWLGYGLYRGSTSIKGNSYIMRSQGGNIASQIAYTYLDSPNTTSATTYKTMFKATSGSCQVNDNSAPSTITLMEVAG